MNLIPKGMDAVLLGGIAALAYLLAKRSAPAGPAAVRGTVAVIFGVTACAALRRFGK